MTIALICMVLIDVLVTKSAGGHSLTQVRKRRVVLYIPKFGDAPTSL
jgi:hypothetical protein